jgi:ribosomal protein RSM22 (predicted rRNA methylase)
MNGDEEEERQRARREETLALPEAFQNLILGYRAHYGGIKQKIITDGVRTLNEMFTGGRPRRPGYLAKHNLRQAYVVYYLPVNYAKTRLVLRELKKFATLPAKPRVLDFGSGPGTASLAAVDELDHPQLTLVDVVGEAHTDAEWLLGTYAAGRASFRFRNDVMGRYDLILATNVLAEMSSAAELRTILEMSLEPGGYFVLIEPASKQATQRVEAWRDELAAAGWTIAAPCMGAAVCPLRSNEEFWCHQDLPWSRPAFIDDIDRSVGLDKRSLEYSYLIITKAGAVRSPGAWRVVSNTHRAKGRVWMALCGPTLVRAELLTRFRSEKTADFEHARRGDVLVVDPPPTGRFPDGTTVRRG